MKKLLTLCMSAVLLLTAIPLSACGGSDETQEPAESTDTSNTVQIVKDAASEFVIVRSNSSSKDSLEKTASFRLQTIISDATGVKLERKTDVILYTDDASAHENAKEILIGSTNRKESESALAELAFNEYIIKVDGPKIVICGACEKATLQAVEYFGANYVVAGEVLEIPSDLMVKGYVDMTVSSETGVSYEDMGDRILEAYADEFIDRQGSLKGTEFWDTAEILEAFIDAYEQTGKEQYLKYAENIAKNHFKADESRVNWCGSNAFNDDIAWLCIGLTRLYNLTGNRTYLTIAKNNFNSMWDRAYSPDVLGGGLWWKDDQKTCKNSCIQCPASIAACLIGKASGDDSYYEKAKEIMEWEFETLFEESTGKVYDSINTDGTYNYWASTYNQGTFVGACTLLHEKYGDQKYLDYAAKAVEYGMTKLDNKDGVLNGEASGADLIGFKGILTRWFYRYAQYTNDLDVLGWLQKNADVAFSNRNSSDIVWTAWADKTLDQDYDPWGCSAAIALMFNCEPWW
ncbi:MAG: glycoside hydrolase family 88 protein [Clostridia bacterium]|nr:glycoside hydrolase family 88 protein [Clostridia bacterium]